MVDSHFGECPIGSPSVGMNRCSLRPDRALNKSSQYGSRLGGNHGQANATGRAAGDPEDDGWLMSFVYDLRNNAREFVILDARAIEGGRRQGALPRRVPNGIPNAPLRVRERLAAISRGTSNRPSRERAALAS